MSGCQGVGGPDHRKLERAFGLGEAEGTRPLLLHRTTQPLRLMARLITVRNLQARCPYERLACCMLQEG